MADRSFYKNKPAFMKIYNNITSKACFYVLLDNKADAPARMQVVADLFGNWMSFIL